MSIAYQWYRLEGWIDFGSNAEGECIQRLLLVLADTLFTCSSNLFKGSESKVTLIGSINASCGYPG
jgi:hypothetical protein